MIWGCMGWDGVGYMTRIEGRMDAPLYTSILDDELMRSVRYWKKPMAHYIFQQDNDPKHTSAMATNSLKRHHMRTMVWPSQSPDLNPIEHLWNHLKRQLNADENKPRGIEALWERTQEEWWKIPVEVVRNLIRSMPSRVEAVYKAKGGYVKY